MSIFEATWALPLLTLTLMETVLGIDNVIFISILVSKLPISQRESARKIGLFLALFMRLILLFSISWLMGLSEPWIQVFSKSFSGRDLILLFGGLFLIAKSTHEIYNKVEIESHIEFHSDKQNHSSRSSNSHPLKSKFASILFQVVLLDIVFSLDSVITAVGMAQEIWIMAVAVVLSVGIMLLASKSIGSFVEKHPSVKLLALSFLLLIGVMLLMEGMGSHVEKGYIYFAMFFSLLVELLNMRFRLKGKIKTG